MSNPAHVMPFSKLMGIEVTDAQAAAAPIVVVQPGLVSGIRNYAEIH